MKRTILAASVIAALALSCKKGDKPFVISKETIAGNYKFTGALAGGVNVYDNPDASKNIVPDCAKDDIHHFNVNETYEIMDVGVACDPSTDETGTWKFVDASHIIFNGEHVNIKSFDGRKILMTIEDNAVLVEITFTKQ